MKTIVYIVLSLVSLPIHSILHAQEVTSEAIVRSINYMNSANPATFSFLKGALKNKRIVLLGEKTHSDGSTLELKVELIKYLHDSLNFKVLFVESGIYETDRAWRDIVEGKDSASGVFAYLFNRFPDNITAHHLELAHYMQAKLNSDNPLILNGIDICSGSVYDHAFLLELEKLLRDRKAEDADKSVLADFDQFALKGKRKKFDNSVESLKWLKSLNLDSIASSGHRIISYLQRVLLDNHESQNTKQKIPLMIQGIRADIAFYPYLIEATERMVSNTDPQLVRMKDRDSLMAENLKWYLDNVYPDEKVIVSLATTHASKDMRAVRDKYDDFAFVKPVGEYLQRYYKDDVYSMAFVNYTGTRRNYRNYELTNIPTAPEGSMEKALHDVKCATCYVDFSNEFIKSSEFAHKTLAPIFDKWYQADWSKAYDGIMFIDTMQPIHFKIIANRAGKKQPYEIPSYYYQ